MKWSLLIGLMLSSSLLANNIVVTGTRFIYPEGDKEITVHMFNSADRPALSQVWLDEGDESVSPDNITTPFVISPPISKMEPKSGQVIRIKALSEQEIPKDRESIWWLNILDIPAIQKVSSNESKAILQMAVRSRFKFMYRPDGLGDREKALEELRVEAKGNTARLYNPTPFYITIVKIARRNGKALNEDAIMIAPKMNETMQLKSALIAGDKIEIGHINDFGGMSNLYSTIN